MERRDHIDTFGGVLLVIASAVLGLNQVMVKMVNVGFSPVFQAGFRSACAFLPVLLFALYRRKTLSIRDGTFWYGVLAGLFFSSEFLLLFTALDYTSVSRASVIFYSMPIWVAIGAHFLIARERLTPIKAVGLLLAIVGVAIALAINESPATEGALIGDLMCLAASILWAAIILTIRTTPLGRSTPEMQLLYQLAISAVVLLLVAPLGGPVIRELSPQIIGLFTVQVFLVISIGFLLWFWILSIYPASDMAAFSFLSPVFGVIFGWLILDEAIGANIILALALVALGIALIAKQPKLPFSSKRASSS